MIEATKPIRPFSCGTQYGAWMLGNCDSCERDEENCPISEALAVACWGDGTVSPDIAKRMGYTDFGWGSELPRYGWPCLEHEPPFDLTDWVKRKTVKAES